MSNPTVFISGLGLMGGSLAAALSAAGWPVHLHHRRREVAERAAALGYGSTSKDLRAALAASDLVVVCTHFAKPARGVWGRRTKGLSACANP